MRAYLLNFDRSVQPKMGGGGRFRVAEVQAAGASGCKPFNRTPGLMVGAIKLFVTWHCSASSAGLGFCAVCNVVFTGLTATD
jgi:hypothetical protein